MNDAGFRGLGQSDPVIRAAIVSAANGYFAETFDRKVIAGAAAAVDGTVYFTSIGLLAGELVSAIAANIGAAGSGFTLAKMGLYDRLGNRLAVSADQGSAWTAAGLAEAQMIAPYRAPAPDVYYVALVAKASGMPTVVSVAGASQSFTRSAASPICALMLTQTDLPAVATYAINPATVLAKVLWMGLR